MGGPAPSPRDAGQIRALTNLRDEPRGGSCRLLCRRLEDQFAEWGARDALKAYNEERRTKRDAAHKRRSFTSARRV
jgi:hypothetical protein